MSRSRGRERFRPSDRLRRSRDYRRVSSQGRRRAHGTVLMLLAEPDTPKDMGDAPRRRLGITVSRRVGRAVVRNRVKRAFREYFRRHRHEFPPGDTVLIARPSAGTAPLAVLQDDLAAVVAQMREAP